MSLFHLSRISPGHKALCLPLVVTLLLQFAPSLYAAQVAATGQSQAKKSERFITIDFDNVEIHLFIKYISELTGTNFVVDKAVQGNVTIISPTKISEDEAYQLFESVLEVNGFTTVPAGAITKIMPASRALSQNISTLSHGGPSRPEDKIVTQIIPLRYTTPEEMKKVLAPLVSKTSVVIAHTQSGMLIVTETLSNIQKLLAIIESIDIPLEDEEIAVIPLNHASATVAATAINTIFQQAAVPNAGRPLSALKIVAYEPINSIIVVASPTDIARIKHLISVLDTEMKQNEGNIHVVYLQHATAKELSAVLTALPGQKSSDPTKKGEAPIISKDVNIMADTETNSLIITASRSEFKELESVIKKLDIPRRMVYLEALIMEVAADSLFNVGVNWMAGDGVFADGTGMLRTGFGGSANYSQSTAFPNTTIKVPGIDIEGKPVTLEETVPAIGPGFSLGVLQKGIKIGGVIFPNIHAVIKALKGDSTVNIIATPQILTLDNKKAEISVGENRPYLTRTQESTGTGAGAGTDTGSTGYQNYEYKDIATKLTITPQINQADILRLEIATEVSKLKSDPTGDKPTTFKRTATTTVLVKDNDTIVIGGIIGQDDTAGESKVPLLGDIPVLGWLFKEKKTSRNKTNMFIFITPRIIKNPGDMTGITAIKTDVLEKVMPDVKQLLINPTDNSHVMSLIDRGFEQMQKGNYAEAKENFNKALSFDAQNPYAQFNLATISEREGNPQEAIKLYQMILDYNKAEAATNSSNPRKVASTLLQACKENIERLQKMHLPMESGNQNQ